MQHCELRSKSGGNNLSVLTRALCRLKHGNTYTDSALLRTRELGTLMKTLLSTSSRRSTNSPLLHRVAQAVVRGGTKATMMRSTIVRAAILKNEPSRLN